MFPKRNGISYLTEFYIIKKLFSPYLFFAKPCWKKKILTQEFESSKKLAGVNCGSV